MTAEEALEIIVDLLAESGTPTRPAVLSDIETLATSYDEMDFEIERNRQITTAPPASEHWTSSWTGWHRSW